MIRVWAVGLIAVGVLLIIIGLALAITEMNAGSSNPMVPEAATHAFTAITGLLIVIVGVILTIVGLVVSAETQYEKPAQPPVYPLQPPSGTVAFCPYCGTPLYGSMVCSVCGRSVQM
jgi:uncharacterized membrane protein